MSEIKLENEVLEHIYDVLRSEHNITIISSTSFTFNINENEVKFEAYIDKSGQVASIFITDKSNTLNPKKYYDQFKLSIKDAVDLVAYLTIARHYYNDTPIEAEIAISELKEAFSSIKAYVDYRLTQMVFNDPDYDFTYMVGGYPIVIKLIINNRYQVDPIIGGDVMDDVRQKIIQDCTNVQNLLNKNLYFH
jgi:hypothetical protein